MVEKEDESLLLVGMRVEQLLLMGMKDEWQPLYSQTDFHLKLFNACSCLSFSLVIMLFVANHLGYKFLLITVRDCR